ncbi:hypothetical protein RHMOL_Rhmol02G0316100 [Rhododendron molle]|uniref:Uncharacterized protein n=1 Tax=Rhododendron molle TaxID=49168 RepID=A0ACC0PW54_RHOML|nr:hypothetical protein RHMOL_Rhmol02G0316100 [Rhododendron molle]
MEAHVSSLKGKMSKEQTITSTSQGCRLRPFYSMGLFLLHWELLLGSPCRQQLIDGYNIDTNAKPMMAFTMTEIPTCKEDMVETGDILSQVSQTHDMIMTLDKSISSLEMRLSAARASKADNEDKSPLLKETGIGHLSNRPKVFFVMGIITAFSSRKRRDSIRDTWMPKGEDLKKLEKEKGIIIRFVIGHSATPGGVLDRAIEAEEEQHKDFLRLNHVEGYHELSSKTQIYIATAAATWDADFYVKVDDDVHVNLGMVGSTLARHRSKPRVYVGCMKSGPVLAQKGVKYHEPEYWKFGEEGNKYFRHATGQIYAISKNLATYISVNRPILHRFANEDVSLGSWFIGLDVEHVDDRNLCCGTPTDCEYKAQAGNPCAASFDWSCSGVCQSVERMEEVHQRCGEGDGAIWHTSF